MWMQGLQRVVFLGCCHSSRRKEHPWGPRCYSLGKVGSSYVVCNRRDKRWVRSCRICLTPLALQGCLKGATVQRPLPASPPAGLRMSRLWRETGWSSALASWPLPLPCSADRRRHAAVPLHVGPVGPPRPVAVCVLAAALQAPSRRGRHLGLGSRQVDH